MPPTLRVGFLSSVCPFTTPRTRLTRFSWVLLSQADSQLSITASYEQRVFPRQGALYTLAHLCKLPPVSRSSPELVIFGISRHWPGLLETCPNSFSLAYLYLRSREAQHLFPLGWPCNTVWIWYHLCFIKEKVRGKTGKMSALVKT